jgi:hypothetical protein
MRSSVAGLTAITLLIALLLPAHLPPASGSEANTPAPHTSRHFSLPATPENVQWGWYDPGEKPKLVISSGDTVSIETISHSLGQKTTAVARTRSPGPSTCRRPSPATRSADRAQGPQD